MTVLQDYSEAIIATAGLAARSVAAIHGGARFGASGVVWQPGVVVTTRSTLRRDENLRVTLDNGTTAAATIAGHDPGTDLAILRFEGESETHPAPASAVRPGEIVLAVGRSENTGPNVAWGLVSAVGQPWETWQGGRVDGYIRVDVNLYPGGSGAAVVNADGALVGILSGALSRIAPVAIPTATVERVVGQLLTKGSVGRAWIGVGVQPVALSSTLAEAANSVTQGLVVLSADETTPAGRAGILVGDILLSVNDSVVGDPFDLRAALLQSNAGDEVRVRLLRGGEPREVTVTLGERPNGRGRRGR